MATKPLHMVRGSVIRLTRLDHRGEPVEGARSTLVSRNVTRVAITERTSMVSGQVERNDLNRPVLYTPTKTQTTNYAVDIDFALTSPDAIEIATGEPVVRDAWTRPIGFDAKTHLPVRSFALEVWSKLAANDRPLGYRYGYTLFPFLSGGYVSGTTFDGGAVTFSVRSARTRRGSRWGTGPYVLYAPAAAGWDLYGWDDLPWDSAPWGRIPIEPGHPDGYEISDNERLHRPVARDLHWTTFLTPGAPAPTDGARPLPDPEHLLTELP